MERSGRRIGPGTVWRFIYAGQQSIEELDGTDDLLRLFVFTDEIDGVVMMEAEDVADVDDDANTTELMRFFFHTQLIGSVTQVTGPNENVVESYDYSPYGEIEIEDKNGGSVSGTQIGNPFTFTGRRLDEETGLYYYRARHYSAELGRFIQRDPLEYVDGPNAFAYVRCSPTSRTDALGLASGFYISKGTGMGGVYASPPPDAEGGEGGEPEGSDGGDDGGRSEEQEAARKEREAAEKKEADAKKRHDAAAAALDAYLKQLQLELARAGGPMPGSSPDPNDWIDPDPANPLPPPKHGKKSSGKAKKIREAFKHPVLGGTVLKKYNNWKDAADAERAAEMESNAAEREADAAREKEADANKGSP